MPSPAPDLVLTNANVHTLDPRRPWAQAVAVTGDVISAVGTSAELAGRAGRTTRVIDLAGATLLPGFVDSHAHVVGDPRTRGGLGFVRLGLDLKDAASWDDVVEEVRTAAAARPPGEWVLARGWHEGRWRSAPPDAVRGFPTHERLSAAVPDHPVLLERADTHATLANARAMALAGLTETTAAPPGGEILKDARGRLTGVLVDHATGLLRPPPASADEMRHALDVAMDECARNGVTSVTEAGADLPTIALYREYAAAGRLRARFNVMALGLETMRGLGRPLIGEGGLLTVRTVKLFADGALGSRGAALLEPYDDDPGNTGLLRLSHDELLEACRFALRHGFQAATHAIGDRANRLVLDAYEQALSEPSAGPPSAEQPDHRFRIEHAQLLDPADLPRFARLGVIASIQACHCPSDAPWVEQRIGRRRLPGRAYAWATLLRSGARVINGTDAPVEDLSPVQNFFASVTRRDPAGRLAAGPGPEERMTREEALRSCTIDAAYGSFEEQTKGSIEPGKQADLVALSRDLLRVPEEQILEAEVRLTVVAGRVQYQGG